MRTVMAAWVLLAPAMGDACTIATVLEPQCQKDPDHCVRRDLLADYGSSDVVYEATVDSVRRARLHGDRISENHVVVRYVWKTDGKALDPILAGWGGGDCSISLRPGITYVFFARRVKSSWAWLPWASQPLHASILRTYEVPELISKSPHHGGFYAAKSPSRLAELLQALNR